jgi:hypothetical protein
MTLATTITPPALSATAVRVASARLAQWPLGPSRYVLRQLGFQAGLVTPMN